MLSQSIHCCFLFCFSDPPIVSLRLGSTLSADDIKEGDDVYFECHVQANPQWRKLYWLHDVNNFFVFTKKKNDYFNPIYFKSTCGLVISFLYIRKK